MKNKIVCLFNEIKDLFEEIDWLKVVTILVWAVVAIVICACAIGGYPSSAADEETMTLKAGTYTFKEVIDVYLDTITTSEQLQEGPTAFNLDYTCGGVNYSLLCCYNANGTFQIDTDTYEYNNFVVLSFDDTMAYVTGSFKQYSNGNLQVSLSRDGWDPFNLGTNYQTIVLSTDQTVSSSHGTWFIANTNYNEVNGETHTCPTLVEQIADYSGTWSDFASLISNNNTTLYEGYRAYVDESFVAGKLNARLPLYNFEGDYEELVTILNEMSDDNPNIQAALEQELQRQFENGVAGGYDDGYSDGKDYGQEVGYNEGYQSGYNKGASDELVNGFFGNMFLGITEAIDSIHIYEEYNEEGVLTFYLSPWSILITLAMVSIVIILLKVWRGG